MPKYRIEGQVYEANSPEEAYAQAEQAAPAVEQSRASVRLVRGSSGQVTDLSQMPSPNGLVAQFNQGLSLGGADEIAAGAEAAFGGNYADSMARQKAAREAYSRENPIASGIATAAGAVAPVVMSTLAGGVGGPPGMAAGAVASGGRALQLTRQALGLEGAQAVGRSNTVLQGMKEGARAAAVPGTTAGYLSAQPGNRDAGAVEGLIGGVALGGTLGGGIQAAQNFGGKVTPYLERVGNFLGIREGGMSWAQPPTRGGGNVTPITKDEAMILQRMEEGGITPEAAALTLIKARDAGVPLALVDVGGQPLQRLTRGIRVLPGQASATIDNALSSRAAAAPDRLIGHLEGGIGRQASGNAGAVADDLLRQARTDSGPLYQQLERLPAIQDQAVADVFRVPAVQQIVQRAEANAAKFGQPINPLFDEQGNLLREPTFVDVDRVKQSLDELLSPTYSMGPRPADAPALATRAEQALARNIRTRLVSLADNAPGGATYRKAREAYAIPARAREKYNEGLDFSRKDTSLEDVRAIRREGSPSDRKWYDRGVMEGLRGKVQGVDDLTGQPNALRQFWGSPEARGKINAVVNPRRAGKFTDRMIMENQAAQTNSFVRSGSQTADKSAEAIDVAADLVGSGGGGPKAVAAAAAQKLWERVRMNANEQTRQLIAEQVVNMNPAQQQAFLQRLSRLQSQGQINATQIATVANIVTKQQATR